MTTRTQDYTQLFNAEGAFAQGFPSGTVMLFAQTTAPTGFTKNTSTGNNSSLRVTTGTCTNGGTVDFSTAFASQTPAGTVSVSGSVGNTTLSIPQIPSHTHSFSTTDGGSIFVAGGLELGSSSSFGSTVSTSAIGGGGAHNHPFSTSSATFSGNAINLAVKFVDVIQATKD